MAMEIYEPRGLRRAWMGPGGSPDGFVVETEAGQFRLATDRPWRSATLGVTLLSFIKEPYDPSVPRDVNGKERGWEAWVFDRRINALFARELERVWETDMEREYGEEMPLPTDEETDAIYDRLKIPQAVTDVINVFHNCVEVDDAGHPVTGVELPIEAFWASGRFAPVSRERIAKGNWDPQKKRFVGSAY